MVSPFFQRFFNHLTSGIDATQRVWSAPTRTDDTTLPDEYVSRNEYYLRLWSYYNNTAFDDTAAWESYREKFGLYRFQRSIYNPTRRLVDFYVHQVYPGFVTTSDLKLPEGLRRAIEFENTSPELMSAIGQFWHWTNFQTLKDVIVLRGAALGNCLVELVDDLDRKKIWAECWWPGHATEIKLDSPSRGNVTSYTLSYRTRDEKGDMYTFRKQVDKEAIRYFRDGQPFSFNGRPAVIPNPYPFVPAVWVRHRNTGETYSQPAIGGSLAKIDERNMLVSWAHDRLYTLMQAPVIISSGGDEGDLDDIDKMNARRRSTSEEADTATNNRASRTWRERMRILIAPEGSTVSTINLDVGETLKWVQNLTEEIEAEHRELSVFQELSRMSITTGPAMTRLMKDVSDLLLHVQGNYDRSMESLFRMAVAMGGWRANSGAWGPAAMMSDGQRKFLAFDFDSYDRGDLDMTIIPRELFPQTEQDKWSAEKAKQDALFVAKQNGIPDEARYILAGADQETASAWARHAEAEAQKLHDWQMELKGTGSSRTGSAGTGVGTPGPEARPFAINNNGRPIPRRAQTAIATPSTAGRTVVRRISTRNLV